MTVKPHGQQEVVYYASISPVWVAVSFLSRCKHCKFKLCTAGNARVTDSGVASLAEAPAAVLQQLQELVLDAVQCTWEGIKQLLNNCTGLRKVELFGMSAS